MRHALTRRPLAILALGLCLALAQLLLLSHSHAETGLQADPDCQVCLHVTTAKGSVRQVALQPQATRPDAPPPVPGSRISSVATRHAYFPRAPPSLF